MHLTQFGTELRSPRILRKEGEKCFLDFPVGDGGFLTIAADWCGFCQRLAPVMKEAKQHYGFKSFYMDGDKKAVQGHMQTLKSEGFPTLYLVLPSGELKPYDGPQTKEALGQAYIESKRLMSGGYGCASKNDPISYSIYQVQM